MKPLGLHCSHRFRIKSTAGVALGDCAGDGGGGAVDAAGAGGELEALAADAGRRAIVAGGTSVLARSTEPDFVLAGALGLPVVLVGAGGVAGGLSPSAADSASLFFGGGGGMSRAGPVVGSNAGVADASVVAALASELEADVLRPLLGGPDTAAATSTPRRDIATSSPAHGSHGGSVRLCPGMIAVGRSRLARSVAAERPAGLERFFSRW